METFPGMGDASLFARPAHARGEVLEMPDWIAKEALAAIGGIFHDPLQGEIRPRPFSKDGFIPAEIGRERFIELEDGLRWFPLKPMPLGEAEGIEIKGRAAIRAVAFRASRFVIRKMGALLHGNQRTPQSKINPDWKILSK